MRVALAREGGGDPADSTYGVSATAVAPVPGRPGMPMVTLVQTSADMIKVEWMPPSNNGGSDITGYVAQIRRVANQMADWNDDGTATTHTAASGWVPNQSPVSNPDPTNEAEAGLPPTGTLAALSATARETEWSGLVKGVMYEVRVFAQNSVQTGVDDSEVLAFTSPGMKSITMAEAADISLLTFTGTIESDSTTGSSAPQLTVTIPRLSSGLPVGSSIVLYLEDDFQEPDSIPASSVYFIADRDRSPQTGNGSPVRATVAPRIKTDDYFDATKKDISIQVFIPDMCTSDSAVCQSADGPTSGQRLQMVIEDTSGIKNPSEQGKHSAAFRVLGPGVSVPGPTIAREDASAEEKDEGNFEVVTEVVNEVDTDVDKFALPTVAKVSLSDENNARGYELLVTGSGFNDKTTATAYVMTADAAPDTCQDVVDGGSDVGSAIVGSDDKVSVTVTVSVPAFKPGKVNQICLLDGEGRTSGSDVETFELEDSIRVVPATVNAGDTVTIFGQDFKGKAAFSRLDLQGKQVFPPRADATLTSISVSPQNIGDDGSSTVTFEMPGSIDGGSVQGVIAVKAYWGTSGNASTTITVAPARLALSKTEALPNESITIQGNGFGDGAEVAIANITIDDVALLVDEDSHSDKMVDVSSGGQFVATVHLWPQNERGPNPLLVSGAHTIKVMDNEGFVGTAIITIPEPAISVVPAVAGPRDFINISGENWPVDNLSGGSVESIDVTVDGGGRSRIYSALIDNSGRFNVEHRVASNVSIPSTNQIKVEYGSEIVKISEYKVPAATIMVEPAMAKPGEACHVERGRNARPRAGGFHHDWRARRTRRLQFQH